MTQNLADSREMQTLPVDITATSVDDGDPRHVCPRWRSAARHGPGRRGPVHDGLTSHPIWAASDSMVDFRTPTCSQRPKIRPAADTGAIRSGRVGGRRRSARGHRRAHRRHSDARHRHAGAHSNGVAGGAQPTSPHAPRGPAHPCASSAASAMTISVTSWSANFPLTASTCGCNAAVDRGRWSCSSVLTESGRCCPTAAQLSNWWNLDPTWLEGVTVAARAVVLVAQRADRIGQPGADRRPTPAGRAAEHRRFVGGGGRPVRGAALRVAARRAGGRRRVRQRAGVASAADTADRP